MNPSSWLDIGSDAGVAELLWQDGERRFYKIWRESEDGTHRPRLAVLPATDHPTPAILNRLTHEHELKDRLDSSWAVRPVELVRERGTTALVLEHHDGEPLDRRIAGPMEVGGFLRIAVALGAAMVRLHERGLVHKDIKPANVLVDPAGDRVRLMGFGVASRLPRERLSPELPELIAGTLAYMAPEQTGRMNRAIDARSDLYALGVTLYEMLTGALPFTAADPMEWVHCHIARRPMPPGARVGGVPPQLSAIVMTLLAKTPEERYQTAAGVERDLRRCLTSWESSGRVDEFPPGEHDTPDRLLIPERLYGRDREIDTLLTAFDRVVATGMPSLVLVSGHPGIGKSSVVNELHKVLVPPRGLFASGKFDQLKRDIPYATLAQAFQGLTRQLLGKPEDELRQWRDELRQALDPNGALLLDLIPELKFIIGEQRAVADVPPADAKTRFQTALRGLIRVFARAEHPLALFLDDLQWLDGATLDLLENILVETEPQHLLLVGAYRDSEVDAAHPLMRKLAVIRESGAVVREVVLGPLANEDLTQWFADALRCPPDQVLPLAQLVHEKTAGNAFFANQFFQELVEDDLITFERRDAEWRWDLALIRSKGYTDNVVDLMVGKLSRLPLVTQETLKGLACLGNGAKGSTLATVQGTPEEQLHSDLWEALRLELIVRSEDSYRFAHDRVQEAVYSLIPAEQRAQAHLRIGRLLARHNEPEQREEAVFEIVGHFNRAAALLASEEERDQVAGLNLAAGKRAKKAAAFASALSYFTAGSALMANDGWSRRHDLVFQLEIHRAECEFLNGDIASAEQRLTMLSSRAATVVEECAAACLAADLSWPLQRPERGLASCLECLHRAGLEIPMQPTKAQAQAAYDQIYTKLEGLGIDELAERPLMTDPTARAILDVIAKIAPTATITDVNLASMLICAAVDLGLKRGHCDSSCFAYDFLGYIAGWHFGDFEACVRFGWLGLELAGRKDLRAFESFIASNFSATMMPWAIPIANGRELIRTTFGLADQSGDRHMAVAIRTELILNLLWAGDTLVEAEREAEVGLEFCRKAGFRDYFHKADMLTALMRNLRGLTRQFGSLDDPEFNELRMQTHFENEPHLIVCEFWYSVTKLQARFLAGDYAGALDASIRAETMVADFVRQNQLWATDTFRVESEFYGALAHAAACDSASGDERREHLDTVAGHLQTLELWARHCPANFANRAALVAAELARVEGRDGDARRLYEDATRSARENGFIHHEAIALELAARFYAARGFDRIATAYLRDARSAYRQWGAEGKVRQLDEHHPHLGDEDPRANPTHTVETPVETLDLAVVLRVLEAVSGETDLEKLIATVMRLGLEHAGAERGLLILPLNGAYRIEATAEIGDDGVTVGLNPARVTAAELPESVFQYVLRTRDTVLLHNAPAGSEFSNDDYLRRHRARSVLCMPLRKQTRMVGVLYLENRLTSGVFTPSRMALLKLLASEAAISIENARLYRDLQEREARVRRLIDANIIGMFIWHADGRVFEANEELLRIIGYSRADLVSGDLRWTDFTLPESRERDLRILEDHKLGGAAKAEEREFLRKDGTRVPVLTGGTMFEGELDEGVAFVVDLTERKRAEQALREREHESRLILNTIPGLVAVLTPTGEVDAINHELVNYCGQPLEAMKHWATNGIVHRDDLPHMGPIFARSIASGEPYDFETRIRRFDGVYRWLQIRGLPLRDTSGQIARWYVVLSDIEDRKRAEDTLDQAREELARVSRVMTLSALTASITHEVNQPLSGIMTNAGTCLRMLDASPPNIDGARETTKRTIRDGHRASEVIERLRGMFTKKEFAHEAMDLNEATREVISLLLNDLQRNRVALQLDLAEALPLVMGDRVQLQQVILNLVRNASEAMADVDDRLRRLVVRTEAENEEGVRVIVRDAGVGLDRENLNRLFDAFYTTKQGGMGIGLSVSRSIIERHHGRMWAEPNDGPGATFVFSLPRV